MTAFDFLPMLAVDPTDPTKVVAGATFVVVPEGATDVSSAITVRDLTDVPITTLTSSAQGVVPAIRTTDVPSIVLICTTAGITYRSPAFSGTGLLDATREARDAALLAQGQAAAAATAAAATAAAAGIPSGGSVGDVVQRGASGTVTVGPAKAVASNVSFAPAGSIVTATTVQDAVTQLEAALGSGGAGTGGVTVGRLISGTWKILLGGVFVAIPSAKPSGIAEVAFSGPSQPSGLPTYFGTNPTTQILASYKYSAA